MILLKYHVKFFTVHGGHTLTLDVGSNPALRPVRKKGLVI